MDRLWRFVTGAPLTFAWLPVLLITTIIQHSVSGPKLHALLAARSTNLHHLAADPERVLFSSLLWIDGSHWWPYLIVFTVFLAPAERWLGSLRWLAVGLVAHIVATYLSEGYLYWTIQQAEAALELIDVRDIGVSYFVVGIIGVLTYHIARPWRWVYLGVAVVLFGGALLLTLQFTPLGHFCSLLIGLACYPLTRARPQPPWHPASVFRRSDQREAPPA